MHRKRFILLSVTIRIVCCKLRIRTEVAFVSTHVSDFSNGLLKYFWVIFYCMRYLTCFLYFFSRMSHVFQCHLVVR